MWPGCGLCHPFRNRGGEHEHQRAIRPRYWGYALSVALIHRDIGRAPLARVRGWLCGLLYVGHLRQAGHVHTVASAPPAAFLAAGEGDSDFASKKCGEM